MAPIETRPRKPGPAYDVPLAPGSVVPASTPAAAAGQPWIETPQEYDGILLASFGGPEGQDDVMPFLRNVTGGRGIPDERLEAVAAHYRHYGGVSPIGEHTRRLRSALQAELRRRGRDLPVFLGNRNWHPYLNRALLDAHAAGRDRLLMIATSAYSSYSSDRQYREDGADALWDAGLGGVVAIDKVRQYFDHPGFVTPFVEGLVAALADLRRSEPNLGAGEIEVLFSTHSIPLADAERSGPPGAGLGPGGAYLAQHLAVARAVFEAAMAEEARVARAADGGTRDADAVWDATAPEWQLVFQSRSGPASQPWLDPDINDVIRALPAHGRRAVVVVPIGFVSDHMEVLWDLDNEARDTAAKAGLVFRRVSTPGVHPAFVRGLADLVDERLRGTPVADRPHATPLGPWYDVARAGDSENVRRGFRPAIAGLVP